MIPLATDGILFVRAPTLRVGPWTNRILSLRLVPQNRNRPMPDLSWKAEERAVARLVVMTEGVFRAWQSLVLGTLTASKST